MTFIKLYEMYYQTVVSKNVVFRSAFHKFPKNTDTKICLIILF